MPGVPNCTEVASDLLGKVRKVGCTLEPAQGEGPGGQLVTMLGASPCSCGSRGTGAEPWGVAL